MIRQQVLPQATPISLTLDQAYPLLSSFNSFLTVAIHNILFYRSIYPPSTFLSTRAYNLPVHQNRHPKVCAWIRDAVSSVATQLATGNVAKIAIVIHAPFSGLPNSSDNGTLYSSLPEPGAVLERWMFDVSRFPAWSRKRRDQTAAKAMADYGKMLGKEANDEAVREKLEGDGSVSWPDVDEQLRGALRKMAIAAERLDALPERCTFTVAVELKGEGMAPIGVSCCCCLVRFLKGVMLTECDSIRRLGFRRSRIFRLRRRVGLSLGAT